LAQDRAEPRSAAAPPSSQWRDLRVRTLSALVAGPVGLGLLWQGGIAWQVALLLLLILMLREWARLARALPLPVPLQFGLGLAYLLPAVSALIWLRDDPQSGLRNVLFVMLVVWASDIGAYCVGRLIGGKRLAPHISPGKTWSGAVGGIASAALVGLIASQIAPGGDAWRGIWVAVLLGVAAELGDLLESALKRQAGAKDSGQFLPGHGGLLDRLDGMLLAAPIAAMLALAAGKGMLLWQTMPLP